MTGEVWGVIVVFGLIGYWLIGFVIDRMRKSRRDGAGPSYDAGNGNAGSGGFSSASMGSKPWHEVLQTTPDASLEQIEFAYRRLVAQYHPDKVATLGPELRALAERMTVELNIAYKAARKARA